MNKIFVFSLVAIFALPACGGGSTAEPNPLTTVTAISDNMAEVLTGIYDDNRSTVYVKVDNPYFGRQQDKGVAQLMMKKRKWEEKNPNKKVVAMATVTGSDGHFAMVVGLLIHYEQR